MIQENNKTNKPYPDHKEIRKVTSPTVMRSQLTPTKNIFKSNVESMRRFQNINGDGFKESNM